MCIYVSLMRRRLPQVAADVLAQLLAAASHAHAIYDVGGPCMPAQLLLLLLPYACLLVCLPRTKLVHTCVVEMHVMYDALHVCGSVPCSGELIFLQRPQIHLWAHAPGCVWSVAYGYGTSIHACMQVVRVISRPSSRHWAELHPEWGAPQGPATGPRPPPAPPPAAPAASTAVAGTVAGAAAIAAAGTAPPLPRPSWARHGPSAVERLAAGWGLPGSAILCPVSVREVRAGLPRRGRGRQGVPGSIQRASAAPVLA